jgi:TatD DNase family protein
VFDTHAHVHDRAFDADRDAMLRRANEAGVERILTVGCDLADSGRAIEAAAAYGLDASIGVHPHEAKDAPDDLAAAFDQLRSDGGPSVIAVGETGLDYYYDHSPRETQQSVLRKHLRYARSLGLPLIFHQRDAFEDFTAILREEWSAPMRGVVHCFTGDKAQARTLVGEFGLKLGIGGVMTFKTAAALREAILDTGLDHVILETDAPYLAPVPHRGKRNEPAFLKQTLQALATLLGREAADVAARTSATASALFAR